MADACVKARVKALSRWLDDFDAVSTAVAAHGDLEALLDAHGGLVKVRSFLPPAAARGALDALRALPPGAWNETSAARDHAHNNIGHVFHSTKGALRPPAGSGGGGTGDAAGRAAATAVQKLFRAVALLAPGALHTFSAACYTGGHHIEPHDDRAYTQVLMDDGSVQECSRRVAAILYLSPDWEPEWGGHLVDLESGETHVPEFNSLVAFRIPRWHQVTPVAAGAPPRYSVFGWFLEAGRLYSLQLGEPPGERLGGGSKGSGDGSGGGSGGGGGSGAKGVIGKQSSNGSGEGGSKPPVT